MRGKKTTGKSNFYLRVLSELKLTTNLTKIQNRLNLKKQNLNYYLRQLKKQGLVINKSQGLWELTKDGKNPSKYGNFLKQDICRGHGNVIEIKLPKEIKGWENRINTLRDKGVHFNLVGAQRTTPRIKVLGRKVWLCNDHLRIYDRPDASYYGENAIESRKQAFWEFYKIIEVIENKLGICLKPFDFEFKKEHFALIKNDLAKHHNEKGEILRIKDESGEWLIIDDSLSMGGELETNGKKALQTNVPMQKWWNDKKDNGFKVTDTFLLNAINQVTQNQVMFDKNFQSHLRVLQKMEKTIDELRREVKNAKKV